METEVVHEAVRDHYGRLAESSIPLDVSVTDCCDDACCPSADALYDVDTGSLPADVTAFTLGCGDPITLAQLEPGQTVLDLGSGGGMDCFLAAQQVGPTGRVIGVDMTPAMIERAEKNRARLGLTNVEFRLGKIESLPAASGTVDVVISNCVINLSPDKQAVFKEAFRVLREGGRLAVSDIVTVGRFTPKDRANMSAWAGCITGAEDVAEVVAAMQTAGFANVSVQDQVHPGEELSGRPRSDGPPRLFSARITGEKPG